MTTPGLKIDQIADAIIAVPGVVIELAEDPPSSPTTVDSTSDVLLMEVTSFAVPYSGEYRIDWICQPNVTGSGLATIQFKAVVDEGFSTEVVAGDSNKWRFRGVSDDDYMSLRFSDYLQLEAGARTLRVYGKLSQDSGANFNFYAAGTDVYQLKQQVNLQLITGSGAGGLTVSYSEISSDQSGIASGSWVPITGLSHTIVTQEQETFSLVYSVRSTCSNTGSSQRFAYRVDGGSWVPIDVVAHRADAETTLSGVAAVTLAAGEHLIEFAIYYGGGTGTVWAAATDMPGTRTWIVQYRGGLVPHKNDGVLIQDKPHAINYLGPGLQATNVDGQVNVSVQSAAEGVDAESATNPSNFTVSDNVSWQDVTDVDVDVVVAEGETMLVTLEGQFRSDAAGTQARALFRLYDSVEGVISSEKWISSDTNADYQDFSIIRSPELTAGSHNIKLQAKKFGAQNGVVNSQTHLVAVRYRGGYVQPDNVPELVYSSASVVNVSPKAGAADRLWLALNDGRRYYADGTLTVDLTTTGLGGLDTGSEASSTWYYCYAVLGSTSGTFDVVASVTGPGSGGPTGYSAWKYLGAVYNNTSGNLRNFIQRDNTFFFLDIDEEALCVIEGLGAQTTDWPGGSWTDTGTAQNEGTPALGTMKFRSLKYAAPPGVTGSVLLGGFIDQDSASDQMRIFAHPGTTSDPHPSLPWIRAFAHVLISLESYRGNNQSEIAVLNDQISFYTDYVGSGDRDYAVGVSAYRDKYLAGRGDSQTQAEHIEDTRTPKGTWATTTTVDFAARPGQPSTTRLTLQDGKQRTMTIGTFDVANGVADWGYDEAASQGNDRWLWFYAVPKSGDDNSLVVRASDNSPSTGPTGYSNFKVVWVTYMGTGALLKVIQRGNEFRFVARRNMIVQSNIAAFAWTSYDLALAATGDTGPYCPSTASKALLTSRIWHSTTAVDRWDFEISYDGSSLIWSSTVEDTASGNTTSHMDRMYEPIVDPANNARLYVRLLHNYGSSANLGYLGVSVLGWTDEWIDP